MRQINLTMAWPAFEWQVEATEAFYVERYKRAVWVIARQNGKTAMAQSIVMERAACGQVVGYFAPAYDRSEEVYNECVEALYELIEAGYVTHKQTKAGWVIRFSRPFSRAFARARGERGWRTARGGAIHFKSLGNAEHIRGGTFNGIVVDEAGLILGRIFRKILLPMIRAKRGWAILLGTPPEDDECPDPTFFRRMRQRALEDGKWFFIHRDYTAHPSAAVREEIEEDRESMPMDEFEREYMATFPEETRYRLPEPRLWGRDQEVPVLPDKLRISSGIDLADNEQEIGDKAAVVTWGLDDTGRVYILAAEYYQNPSEVLDALYMHFSLFKPRQILVQKSSFDKSFIHTTNAAAPNRGYLPIRAVTIGGGSKRRRIMQLEPIARAGKMFVNADLREFLMEWRDFPDGIAESHAQRRRNRRRNHYDMLDACGPLVEESYSVSSWRAEEKPRDHFAEARREIAKEKRRGRKRGPLTHFYRVR